MGVYYNEIDSFAAAWLRRLIEAGHIAPGDVDERDIRDVTAADLRGYTQCHFFAGIGVWSYALRLAGWADDAPVWTGSCPCQPFSAAGRRAGEGDERHLWPDWFRLIRQRRPPILFGEQVASPDALRWLDLVSADLEGAGYAIGAADLCAAGVGAPHIRQRLFFVADAERHGTERPGAQELFADAGRPTSGVADPLFAGRAERGAIAGHRSTAGSRGAGFWRDADWLPCRDEKYRPVEPGTFPLAHGAPARVGRLRGYGNAIVAALAAEFITAARP